MTDGYKLNEIATELGRPPSWVSERLTSLRNELLLQTGLFFPLTDSEYESLRASIERHGVRSPIIIGQHTALIDGRHRLLIAEELTLQDVPALFLDGLDAEQERELAIALNAARRQLTRQQKRTLVETELMRDPARSDRLIASICGVSHPHVGSVRAEIAEQQRTEAVTVPAETLTEPESREDPQGARSGPPEPTSPQNQAAGTAGDPLSGSVNAPRAAVEPERRVTATGALRTVPQRPTATQRPTASLGYVTCGHGQIHTLHRDPDGAYRLEPDRD